MTCKTGFGQRVVNYIWKTRELLLLGAALLILPNHLKKAITTATTDCMLLSIFLSILLNLQNALPQELKLNVYGAGAASSQTWGSCDAYEFPISWVTERQGLQGNAPDYGCFQMAKADGLDDCRKMVRLQLRRGASVIKICASGGVMSMKDNPKKQQISDDKLQVISNEAGRAGRGVAMHAHGKCLQ